MKNLTRRVFAVAVLAVLSLLIVVPQACKSTLGPSPVVGGPGTNPIIWPSWQVASWWIDPINGLDSNPGTSSGTPLKTWHQLNDVIWHCQGSPSGCPRFQNQITDGATPTVYTITFLNSQSGNSDPVYFKPAIEGGALVVLQASLPAVATQTGTLGTVTPQNRSTPQLTASTMTLVNGADGGTAPAITKGELVVDTTHPSRTWTYGTSSPYLLSMPYVGQTVTSPSDVPTQLAWTTSENGDAVNLYSPINVDIADLEPLQADTTSSSGAQLIVYELNVYDPQATARDTILIGGTAQVGFIEAQIQRQVQFATIPGTGALPYFANCSFTGGFQGGVGREASGLGMSIIGGEVLSGGTYWNVTGALIDGDIVVGGALTATTATNGALGDVYLDTGVTLQQAGNTKAQSLFNSSTPVLWGPGTLNVVGRLQYPAGASKAAATFIGITLKANAQTLGCLAVPGASAAFGTCNVAFAAATFDTNLGATSGCYAVPGGGAFCNF